MLTQEQINNVWTVRSDNYNDYVEEELNTNRPENWLEIIESNAPSGRPLQILDAGCGPGFFSVLLSRAGHQVTGIDGSALRPDFDFGVLTQLPCRDISFNRDVTEDLWSDREKDFYSATPLFMLRAVKI